MIAVVSSTVFPTARSTYGVQGGQRSFASPAERLAQTRGTVDSLVRLGVRRIIVADNSGPAWDPAATAPLGPAEVHLVDHHQFANKGISELYLLLAAVPLLTSGEPVMKISGRYSLDRAGLPELDGADILGRFDGSGARSEMFSTRCYVARDAAVFETFVRRTLREVYAWGARVSGARSLLRIVKNSVAPERDDFPYDDPSVSIERASAVVLRRHRYHMRRVETLGIRGHVAGDPAALLCE